MEEIFDLLIDRVEDTLNLTDLEEIKKMLLSIKGNTITTGAGGSMVVADFIAKVLSTGGVVEKKNVRDLSHIDIKHYDNILAASYSGTKRIIEELKKHNKNAYILTNTKEEISDIKIIRYLSSIEDEHSFISLASTLMPLSILLSYYNVSNEEIIKIIEYAKEKSNELIIGNNNIYEILSGVDTSTATTFLETTLTESGIAIPIVHDKYDYCHGRSTTSYKNRNGLIYFDTERELDETLLGLVKEYYEEVIILNKFSSDDVINDFYQTVICMFLTKQLAKNKQMDICNVDYSPLAKKLYRYKGYF